MYFLYGRCQCLVPTARVMPLTVHIKWRNVEKPEPKQRTNLIVFVITHIILNFGRMHLTQKQLIIPNFDGELILNLNKRGGHNMEKES